MTASPPSPFRHLVALVALTLAMVLPGLAGLPVIDRDEARYAQASVQMAESGDLLNIRFQDEARNKKPAGAYWAQTAMIKAFAGSETRRIWAQRLPSVFAALLSVLLLYWGGLRMVGREAAFLGAALLSVSLIFVFEGHIAKTDALLCAATTAVFAALGRLRLGGGGTEVWMFWAALGLSIMIKGPIGLLLVGLSLGGLLLWERELSWAKALLDWKAILVFFAIWLPWAIAIFVVTDGAFFIDSLGQDLGGKVVGAQEDHGAPFGAHTTLISLTLWPTSLFLIPALVFAVRTVRQGSDRPIVRTVRFCLVWAVPFWLVIEIMPTKLPHYSLPVFPALALLMGVAVMEMRAGGYRMSRAIGGALFVLASAGLVIGLFYLQSAYDPVGLPTQLVLILGGFLALGTSVLFFAGRISASFIGAVASAVVLSGVTYAIILPGQESFRTSERVAAAVKRFAPDARPEDIHSPDYAEPSLVYHIGTEIDVTGRALDLRRDSVFILDLETENRVDIRDPEEGNWPESLRNTAATLDLCAEWSEPVSGFNYSKGRPVRLVILRAVPCAD